METRPQANLSDCSGTAAASVQPQVDWPEDTQTAATLPLQKSGMKSTTTNDKLDTQTMQSSEEIQHLFNENSEPVAINDGLMVPMHSDAPNPFQLSRSPTIIARVGRNSELLAHQFLLEDISDEDESYDESLGEISSNPKKTRRGESNLESSPSILGSNDVHLIDGGLSTFRLDLTDESETVSPKTLVEDDLGLTVRMEPCLIHFYDP